MQGAPFPIPTWGHKIRPCRSESFLECLSTATQRSCLPHLPSGEAASALESSSPYAIDGDALGFPKILGEEPLSGSLMGVRFPKARFEFDVMLDLPPVPPVVAPGGRKFPPAPLVEWSIILNTGGTGGKTSVGGLPSGRSAYELPGRHRGHKVDWRALAQFF